MTASFITLANDVRLELLLSPERELLGLGAISVGGVPLRNGQRPFTLRVDTPEGILYTRLLVHGVAQHGDGVAVTLHAMGLPWGRGEYCDEYDQSLYWPDLPAEPVEDTLTLLLAPATLTLDGRHFTGFSYRLHFQSDERRVHRLLTHATWEIGGSITGTTLLSQGQCNMPVYRGSRDTAFTTTCLKTLEQYGSPQGVSYQLAPRGGMLQAFDLQVADAGALLMYWPQFGSICSLLDSAAGVDVLHVVDEYRVTLSTDATTPAKHILFAPGPLAEHEARDLWWAAHEHVYGGIRAAYGITPTLAIPEAGMPYSTRVDGERLRMTVCDREVDSTEVPYAVADLLLPQLAAAGIKRFFPEVMSESDVTEVGMRRKLDDGVHGDLHCSSVCATHRFRPAEFWGGMAGWRYMAEKARALGIEIGAWFAFHYSPRAAIFQEHPDWRMTGVNTLAIGGGYGPSTINVGNWHSGLYDLTLADIRRWKDEGGLDYIFTDSWANMGLVQMNYGDAMRTNFDAEARLLADIQQLGIKAYTFEGISPFGASRFGLADLRGDLLEAMGGVVGQNDFGWWVGEEDMAYGLVLCAHTRKRASDEMARLQFRMMANRAYGMFSAAFADHPWWPSMNRAYMQALPHMITRRLLADGAGVRWEGGEAQVIWAYRDLPLQLSPGAVVEHLDGPTATRVVHEGVAALKAYQVYLVREAAVTV
jgi:hypothetical protein